MNKQSTRPEGPQPKDEEVKVEVKTDAVKPKVKGGAKWITKETKSKK